MAMPFLVILMAAIYVMGNVSVARVQVAVQAKNDAWKQSNQAVAGNALMFQPDAPIQASKSKSVRTIAVTGSSVEVHSKHAVLGGSWDFRSLPMDDNPLPMAARMGASAAMGALGQVQNLGSQLSGLLNQANSSQQNLAQKRQQARQQLDKARAEIQRLQNEIQMLQGQINTGQQTLNNLQQQLNTAQKIKDATARQKEINRINGQRQTIQQNITGWQQQIARDQKKIRELQDAVTIGTALLQP